MFDHTVNAHSRGEHSNTHVEFHFLVVGLEVPRVMTWKHNTHKHTMLNDEWSGGDTCSSGTRGLCQGMRGSHECTSHWYTWGHSVPKYYWTTYNEQPLLVPPGFMTSRLKCEEQAMNSIDILLACKTTCMTFYYLSPFNWQNTTWSASGWSTGLIHSISIEFILLLMVDPKHLESRAGNTSGRFITSTPRDLAWSC